MHSYLLQDEWGQILEAQSISAGLDYPGIGPEHAHLSDLGRATYYTATDGEVLDALQLLSRTEGIIPALEPAHALAWLVAAEAAMREPRRAVASRSSQRLFSPQPVGAHSGRQRTAGAIQLQGLVGESCSVSGAMLSSQEP